MTEQAETWFLGLDHRDRRRVAEAVDALVARGPTLGRPIADRIAGSRHRSMKELRSVGGHLRLLFAFDPRRTAIVLLGGDKAGDWAGWNEHNVPIADDLYDAYLAEIQREGLI